MQITPDRFGGFSVPAINQITEWSLFVIEVVIPNINRHPRFLQGSGEIDLEVFMTEKELYEQEKRRILTPENLEFIRAVYKAIWGGANNDTATNSKRA